ncbi:hypothetical protein M406DRAFT_45232 [Cryphonectria parasitica EP155]|uniref:Carrier domain-containing protein n=1 Tax=Cryphonectria parasitica (strain ATCC 38755 / EP155) TaxID=660469 RepID=A0A9P5CM78_CRYP1|nr:uncharacterized protein M406DRAFT_45232 [Cryphonectria parasitica EP155]KAF3762831.1 hypothetical protein M406DRAFT_45232 [Cryphonectria parasitica EP155]
MGPAETVPQLLTSQNSSDADGANLDPNSFFGYSPGSSNGGSSECPRLVDQKVQDIPIAIVGMACRLPGECSSPSKLWDFLCEGKSSWKPKAPKDRFNWDAFSHEDPDFEGTFSVAGGHFNDYIDLTRFDSAFFGLPPSEARILDPQQRLLLEVSYECLENAGIPMENVAGRKVGCFVAFSMGEYGRLWDKDLEVQQNYHAVGTGEAIYANRISHVYDLAGPSVSFDTGCSGGMVGLDMACNYLSRGAIDGCFVGASNLTLLPEVLGRKPRLLSRSGKCHTFDSAADGFSRADGTSVVFLKRLDDAIRDRDPIRAVIKAVSTNFDGRTPGILMPSKEAQMANIRQAYTKAGIHNLGDTAYFECHGTGTPTGDPIEVDAIGRIFASSKSADDPLLIGSAKTNLGHSEAASALTHIIKASFILDLGLIPSTVGITNLNPAIDFYQNRIKVVQELTPLPKKEIRRVSIQAFGYGGANAHTILESAKDHLKNTWEADRCTYRYSRKYLSQQVPDMNAGQVNDDQEHACRPYLMISSANDIHSLHQNIQVIHDHVMDPNTTVDRLDLAYTLGMRRSKLFYRGFSVLGADKPITEALKLEAWTTGKKEYPAPPRIGFILTGQGAQRGQMGKHLIEQFPSVGATMLRLDKCLEQLPECNRPDWSIREELLKPEEMTRVNDPRFSQPLTCALQIAIINLLRQWGITPTAGVVGHSSGEIPAAYAAGLITERMAIMIGYFRGFSITTELSSEDKLWADASMLATGLGKEAAQKYLDDLADTDLVVACDNSPESTTISGGVEALNKLQKRLEAKRIFARRLKVTKAYHNPNYMSGYSIIFKKALEQAATFVDDEAVPVRNVCPMFSTAIKDLKLQPADVQTGEYWRRNMECPVLFNEAVNAMLDEPNETRAQVFIEIGPSSTLKGPVRQILATVSATKSLAPEEVPRYMPTLIGGSNSAEDMLKTAGTLVMMGCPVDTEKVNSMEVKVESATKGRSGTTTVISYITGKQIVDLPNYAWNKTKSMWYEPRASRNHRFKQFRRHEILGSRVPDGNPMVPTWRNLLSLANTKWLPHHKLHDDIVFPAAGYISMAIEAVRQYTHDASQAVQLRNVQVRSALVMNVGNNSEGIYTFLTLTRDHADSKWFDFTICNQHTDVHCYGQISAVDKRPVSDRVLHDLYQDAQWATSGASGRQWYKHFSRIGFNYTESFQVIQTVRTQAVTAENTAGSAIHAVLQLPTLSALKSRYLVAPAIIDGLMQCMLAAAANGKPGALRDLCVPTKFDEIYVAPPSLSTTALNCIANIVPEVTDSEASKSGILGSAEAVDEDGNVVVHIHRLACTKIEGAPAAAVDGDGADVVGGGELTQVHKVIWKPDVSLLSSFDPSFREKLRESKTGTLSILFDLLAHQDPAASYLEINGGRGNVSVEILSALGAATVSPMFASYTITENNDEILSMAEDKLGSHFPRAHNISYKTLAIESIGDGPSEENTHDVVVHKVSTRIVSTPDDSLRAVRRLMKSNGKLILLVDKSALVSSCLEWKKALSSSGFGLVDADFSENTDDWSLILVASTTDGVNCYQPVHSILHEETKVSRIMSSILSGRTEGHDMFLETEDAVLVSAGVLNPGILAEMSEETLRLIKSLIRKTSSSSDTSSKPNPALIWLSASCQMNSAAESMNCRKFNPAGAMIAGLARVIYREEPEVCFITIDIDSSTPADVLTRLVFRILEKVSKQGSAEREFAIRGGVAYIQRIVPDSQTFQVLHPALEPDSDENTVAMTTGSSTCDVHPSWKLDILQTGLLQTLTFSEVPRLEGDMPLGDHDVEVEMKAVGINFKDVAICMGILPHKNFGLEFSGVISKVGSAVTNVKAGDRVAGLPATTHGAYRSHIRAPDYLCFKIPDGMTFEEAATMPCIFFTNIHALIQQAHMRPGQTILIHSAAGGVGLSAIQLARYLGAGAIYATCGSEEKRKFLVNNMGLNPANIFNSRTTQFQRDIMRATRGKGVDIVLNSLSGDLLDASWACVAETGCLLEVSRVDFLKRNKLQMRKFCQSTSIHAIDASQVMMLANVYRATKIMHDLIHQRVITPIQPMHTFTLDELESAFRLMQSGKSLGKLVIRNAVAPDKQVKIRRCPVFDRVTFSPDASYLLIGCLGGIGRSITRRLFDKGARSFIMLSPSGDDKPEAHALVGWLRCSGASVKVVKGSASNMEDVQRAMGMAPADRPVKGMIHSAMVLNDTPFMTLQSPAEFTKVSDPKVRGAFNMHMASLDLPTPLDFFIMLSSVSGIFGQYGQSSYAAANTYLDALAMHRRGMGLAATSIDLGFVEDVGWTTENEDLDAKMAAMGILTVRVQEAELLRLLELEIFRSTNERTWKGDQLSADSLMTFECQAQTVFGLSSTTSKPPKTYSAPRLRALLNTGSTSDGSSPPSGQSGPSAALIQVLKSTNPRPVLEAISPLALEAVVLKMSEFLLVSVEDIDGERSPESFGVDSLVAVELRTWFRDGFGITVSTMEILKSSSFRSLAETVAKKMLDKVEAKAS